MKTHERSITTRLAVAIALLLLAGGFGVTFAAFEYGRQAADEAYDKLLAGAAFEITSSIVLAEGEIVSDLPVSAFEMLALASDDRVFYRIYHTDAVGAPQTITGYDDLPPPRAAGAEVSLYNLEFHGAPVRVAAMRRRFVERAYWGDVTVLLGQTTRARSRLASDIAGKALIIVSVVGAAMAILAVVAVRLALRPLRRIENALRQRDPMDLTPLRVAAPPEVGAMVGAIDRFMAQLSARVEAMQSLLADATHQLRTPIAALRAQAELASQTTRDQQLQAIVARIHRRTIGLSRLTDQLLNQALIIHRADTAASTKLDLRQVAMRVSEEADHDLFATDATLRLELPETPVYAMGDEFSLVEATKNLIVNAFRHGKTPVTLSVAQIGASAEIMVADRGEGLAPELVSQIGRRQGGALSSDGGAGIGLAIVTAVAKAHGGALRFERPKGGGFIAVLSLPEAST